LVPVLGGATVEDINHLGSANKGGAMSTTAAAPQHTTRERLESFPSYVEAQHVVDTLSDRGFPVERIRILGHGISSVETVTGRWTKGRAALAGAGTGAWAGLLVGLIIGLFLPTPAWLTILLVSSVLGALWGSALGFVTHWGTRGRRDFRSTKSLVAERYDVMVDADWSDEARRVLDRPPSGDSTRRASRKTWSRSPAGHASRARSMRGL
jgi:hypothetical protein